jgi:subtilisin family serine protease
MRNAMSQKHVILRSNPETSEAVSRGASDTVAPSLPVIIEVEALPPHRALAISRTRDVIAVAPVIQMKLIAPVALDAPSDPLAAGSTWGVKAVGADTSPFTGESTTIAVLDTGIDAAHPAFAGVQLDRRNFAGGSDDDEHGHGTHCAGTIFGRAVNGTRIGVAPGVTRALIGKVLGPEGGGSDVILQAIQWASNSGAHVISMSLGIDFPGFVSQLIAQNVPAELATSIALDAYRANVLLFERLASLMRAQSPFMQPTLLVAAAGNESQRNVNADFEIHVSPPAVSEGIISVAALGEGQDGLTIAPFSNVGARLSGPGVAVLSAAPGGGLASMSGTSMATPHVAGVAALWAQKLRLGGQLNHQLLADRLVASASTTPLKAGFDAEDIGAGLAQAPQN